ncbi:MAG TPA: glycerophosphodiester phosphodiesterase family protein [Jatrophihabitans sp.]|jgi:glycerophosphoryl diester phosphodiesterase|nr:glycerophosphodiester phosphodiesterase family protein [Jatrophihabitans sp.]
MSRFLDAPPPIAFAHRGFAPDGAENSMAAFERAVRLGYRYLETDVRVTADGVALAFHDARLNRVTDRVGRVADLSWAEVQRARIGGREPIPLLTDLLAAWPDTRINLDVKSDQGVGPVVDAIRHTGSVERVCVGAFSTGRIEAVRQALGPRLCTSLGPRAALRLKLPRRSPGVILSRCCAQVPARVGARIFTDARYIAAAHAIGAPVHVWTVNEVAEMTRLLDMGVDGIMTDRADVLRDLLAARGQWPART